MPMHLVTGHAGINHVDSESQGDLHCALFGNGEYVLHDNDGNNFKASIISNNIVRISDGNLIMQGRHCRIEREGYVDVPIENGASGYYRKDLIVARYEYNDSDSTESCNISVIKGTPVTSSSKANAPDYSTCNIRYNESPNEMPLYEVYISGLTIVRVTKLFTEIKTPYDLISDLEERKLEANKDINAENHRILNVSTPSMNKDAANKLYVDEEVKKVSDNVVTLSSKLSGVSKIQCGTATIDFSTSSKGSSVSVTFPSAFETVPSVVVQQVFDNANIVVQQADISATGFTAYLQQMTSSGTRSFSWIAIA